MSTSTDPALSQPEGLAKKSRHLAIGTAFAAVLLVPKILHMRRNPNSWMLFRIFLGFAGAALVVLPLGFGTSFVPAIIGLAMFIASILLPPAKPDAYSGEKTRELGALVIVNGGHFKLGNAAPFAAQLFVGAEQISVRDSSLQFFVEIPVSEITSAQAEGTHGHWFLRLHWANKSAAFAYQGVFAEHLARVAESTIRSVMRPALPVLPQRKAAGA